MSNAKPLQIQDILEISRTGSLEGKKMVIMDVRGKDEFKNGHVKNAYNVPVQELSEALKLPEDQFVAQYKFKLPSKDSDTGIAVHCMSGRRAASAANQLADAQYKNVYLYSPGWSELSSSSAAVLRELARVSWLAGVVFVVFSVACGLYVVSEWVEEYPRQTRRLIRYAVWTVDVLLVLALLDGLSIWRIAWTVGANHIYALNLARFPLVQLSSATFMGSCVLAVGTHFLWFAYFVQNLRYPFEQVCSFMFFGVWMVPLALFVSLTPADSSLPSSSDQSVSVGSARKSRQNIFKTILARLRGTERPRQELHND
ncbi:erv26 super protein [Coemansia sp. RSA 2336]|nr:erv26 super protein [Coemansia sp. RSA 2336]